MMMQTQPKKDASMCFWKYCLGMRLDCWLGTLRGNGHHHESERSCDTNSYLICLVNKSTQGKDHHGHQVTLACSGTPAWIVRGYKLLIKVYKDCP